MIVKGAPETAVAALADAPYAVVLAVPNDGPKTIADLKGKKISVSTRGGLTYWLAQELSRRQGWGRKASPSRRSVQPRHRPRRSGPSRSTA